jgi:hypothetical protein
MHSRQSIDDQLAFWCSAGTPVMPVCELKLFITILLCVCATALQAWHATRAELEAIDPTTGECNWLTAMLGN